MLDIKPSKSGFALHYIQFKLYGLAVSVHRPYCIIIMYVCVSLYCSVVLFDEIEKAHVDVFNILLQVG